jgi:hypothetical protein
MGDDHSALTSNAAVTPRFRQALDLKYIQPGCTITTTLLCRDERADQVLTSAAPNVLKGEG